MSCVFQQIRPLETGIRVRSQHFRLLQSALQKLRFRNRARFRNCAIWKQSIHAHSLMTFMVYCDLGQEHPCQKPNDVHGLLRFGKKASMPKA